MRAVLRVLTVTLVAAVAALLASGVYAHDELPVEDSLEIFRRVEGPFEIAITVQPGETVVGPVHLVVAVLDAETSAPVDGAVITIVASDPDGEPMGQVRALNTPEAIEEYHANLDLEFSGVWTLAVEIKKEGMSGVAFQAAFFVAERPLPPGQAGTLLWLAVFAALIGGVLYLWRRSRAITAYR